jgi:hypothetical protein
MQQMRANAPAGSPRDMMRLRGMMGGGGKGAAGKGGQRQRGYPTGGGGGSWGSNMSPSDATVSARCDFVRIRGEVIWYHGSNLVATCHAANARDCVGL